MDNPVVPVVRDARVEDAPAIAAVHVAAWRETYAGIVPADHLTRLSVERRTERWAKGLAERAQITVKVAIRGEGIVGFASGGKGRDPFMGVESEIEAIYLLRSAQGIGLGRALMRDVAIALAVHGAHSTYAWVLRDNLVARRFYEATGGRPAHRRVETIGGTPHEEVAYVWNDIATLTRLA